MSGPGPEVSPGSWPAVPRVRFGAINESWGLYLAQWPTWVVVSLIILASNAALEAVMESAFGVRLDLPDGGFRLSVPPGGQVIHVLAVAVLNGFFLGALVRLACRQLRGLPIGVSDLLGVTDVARELAVGSALYAAGCLVAASLCFLPALVLAGVWMFTIPLIVDGRYGAVDALGRSWTALKGQWFYATLFHLSAYSLAGLGACLCGVGLVVTLPLYALSVAALYRDFHPALTGVDALKPAPLDPDF